MWNWTRPSQLVEAEEAYADAEMDRLRLICDRKRMDEGEYRRKLDAAWRRSVNALEALTILKDAEIAARLQQAAERAEAA